MTHKRYLLLGAVVAAGALLAVPERAPAQIFLGGPGRGFSLSIGVGSPGYGGYGGYGYPGGYGGYGYPGGYGGYGYPGGGYGYNSYYSAPGYGSYYGNGGHDTVPHWHNTYTPYGAYSWFGNGPHDLVPHSHVVTPYSYQGFTPTLSGLTQSIYPRYPYTYAPW